MTWDDLFLICFLTGFGLSTISFLAGHAHFSVRGHARVAPLRHGRLGSGRSIGISPVNFGTVSAFLTWFGGAGYLASKAFGFVVAAALVTALLCGITGASVVFAFLAKVLMAKEEHLDPADFEMTGVLGKVSGTIRSGGTGEILFSQNGVRKAASARSETGAAIPLGDEVVVTRYEDGIAYVRRWDELLQAPHAAE